MVYIRKARAARNHR